MKTPIYCFSLVEFDIVQENGQSIGDFRIYKEKTGAKEQNFKSFIFFK